LQFLLPTIATLWGLFSVAYSVRFIHEVFFGPPGEDLPRAPHDPKSMLVPAALLVSACVLVGMLPARTIGPLLRTAGVALLGDALPPYELAVWHGFTVPLLMSILALVGGAAFYALLYFRGQTMARAPLLWRLDSKRMFDVVNVAVTRGAGRLAERLFPRHLQTQLLWIVASGLAAGAVPLWSRPWPGGDAALTPLHPAFALLWIAGAACAIGAAWQAKFHRLAALIMAAGAGLITSLTFAWFSAPDLALTQLSVEVVTTVLFLLGLRWLPRRLQFDRASRHTVRARTRRARDLLLAVAAGGGIAALAFALLTHPSATVLAPFFVANALAQAGGHNVVNVILVDFRGLDTLGEITVVGSVALIVYGLLRRFRPAPESIGVPRAQHHDAALGAAIGEPNALLPAGELKIPAVLVRLLLPMAGLVSIYF
jgi:multicomponent K+:H+ antiporter subunit A